MYHRIAKLPQDAVLVVVFVYAVAVCFSFGTQSIGLTFIPSVLLGLALLAALYWLSKHEFVHAQVVTAPFPFLPVVIVAAGLALRIAFGLWIRPVPASDMASYDFSARHLLSTGEYVCREGSYIMRAYRPPGLAFLLAVVMGVVGQQWWTALVLNCTLFVLTSVLLWLAAKDLRWQGWALLLGMLAVWPSELMAASLPQSETPSVLVSAALLCVLATARNAWIETVLLGLITGLSCLLRNSNLVVVGVWLFLIAQNSVRVWQRFAMAVLLIVCVFAPIVPWTLRNDRVLGKPVLVATNGGDNLYSSNNSETGGGWEGTSEARLRSYLPDEVAMDKAGYRLAEAWIRAHPGGFLRLSFQKVRLLFGADDWGPYWALERGHGYTGGWYKFSLLAADVWWLLLWGLVLLGLLRHPHLLRLSLANTAVAAFTCLPALLFFVFQSQPRYHAFMIPGLLWLAGQSFFVKQ